ncbi:hypothetical protein BV898_18767 [Hypsibius exemplaris]|uniref:Uncharacterized protein n=1 Tax=Hypsibius exemplaris TaxID=2072580 RepID=A0A9X6NIC8_HYPEX|nr:hypothetical protein BV898_18767 [Hypsibius exemplaris]
MGATKVLRSIIFYPTSKVPRFFTTILALLILSGAFYLTCVQVAIFLYGIYITRTQSSENHGVVEAFSDLPFTLICLRAILVLACFFHKRNTWAFIIADTKELLLCTTNGRSDCLRRVKQVAPLLMITTAALHISWELWEWAHYWVTWSPSNLASLTQAVPFFPTPSDVYTWQFVVIYFLFHL